MVKKNKLYKLNGQSGSCGFFCMFADICTYLYDIDNNIFIHWTNNNYTNNEENALDYIFEQNYPEQFDLIESPRMNPWKTNFKKYFVTKPSSNPKNLSEFNHFFWSTFKINKNLENRINNLRKIKNNKKTLSVHIRRSDILSEKYFLPYINFDVNNYEIYFDKIKQEYIEGQYEKIFLCTEDHEIANFMTNKFSDDIIFLQNNKRASNTIIDSRSSLNEIYQQDKENILLDLMSDVLFAAECEGFLGTIFSGVSIFIEIFNNNKFKKINYF